MTYFVYWIVSGRRSYIGATVDPVRRLRQHCGVIAGGANRTRGRLWKFECVISGFQTWKQALQFEWAAKYYSKGSRSIQARKLAIEAVMQRERWTSNSPLSSEIPLHLEYQPVNYGVPSDFPPVKNETHRLHDRKRWKKKIKTLGGVKY